MAHPTNKQERRDIERRKLLRFYEGAGGKYSSYFHAKFYVKPEYCNVDLPEPIIREYPTQWGYRIVQFCDECINCKAMCNFNFEDNRFESYTKPVYARRFTIVKKSYSSSTKVFYKGYSNVRVRRTKDSYKRGQYKKIFDYWWTID